jgi:Na+-driven multidrug efflux pump
MIIAISTGRGIQIIVGQLVGAGEYEEAYKQVLRNLFRCMLITLAAVYGIWAAFIVDEWVRGLVLFMRWKSRAWEKRRWYPAKRGKLH